MILTKDRIVSYYDKTKTLAHREYAKGEYNRALHYINIAAEIAYRFNWIYCDEELEDLLCDVSRKVIKPVSDYTPEPKRYVVYLAAALDNRGIMQQYLRAFMAAGADLLVIIERRCGKESSDIIRELGAYPRAKIYELEGRAEDAERYAQSVYAKIVAFRPEKAFMHLFPWSGFAVALFDALPQCVDRYQINLTDHAFWLGCRCSDYTLEFRPYGCTVSRERRGIPKERIILQPYYPIINESPFLGFPDVCTPDKTIIFSGGEFYKIYGGGNKYFECVKKILDGNPQAVLVYAGDGDDKPVKEFIAEHSYQDRFILLGYRKDINEVFRHCDIYLATYPATGGLLCQYAAVNGKPILSYNTPGATGSFIENLICVNFTVPITFTDTEDLAAEAGRLINDREYRKVKGEELRRAVMTRGQFDAEVGRALAGEVGIHPYEEVQVKYDAFFERYLELENKFVDTFKLLMVRRFKFATIWLFPDLARWFVWYMASGKGVKYFIKRKLL